MNMHEKHGVYFKTQKTFQEIFVRTKFLVNFFWIFGKDYIYKIQKCAFMKTHFFETGFFSI